MGKLERKVVFLDRDGVINVQRHDEENDRRNYVLDWGEFEFIPYSKSAIRYLLLNEYIVVIISNQACVGKGYIEKSSIGKIHRMMWEEINPPENSTALTFMCPHVVKDECSCRKPKPGMIYAAAFFQPLCLKEAWMVGDTRDDMRAGRAATIRKQILIDDQIDKLQPSPTGRRGAQPTIAPSLAIAAAYIVGQDEERR